MAALRLLFRHQLKKRPFPLLHSSKCHQLADEIDTIEAALQDRGHTSTNTQNLRRVASCLVQRGANMADVIAYFTKRPELIHTQTLHWIKTINFFQNYGCNVHDTLSIVGHNPGVLGLSSEYLLTMFTCLQNQGINSARIISFVQENPHIFRMSPEQVAEKTVWLRRAFSAKDAVKIINSCPNVLLQTDQMLQHKVHYLLQACGVGLADVVNSHALRFSLEHIYTRHEFLCRTGRYVKPKPKMKPQMCRNPPLRVMWASDDDYFANSVAGVSSEEFRVFCKLPQHRRAIEHFVRQIVDQDVESGDESDE